MVQHSGICVAARLHVRRCSAHFRRGAGTDQRGHIAAQGLPCDGAHRPAVPGGSAERDKPCELCQSQYDQREQDLWRNHKPGPREYVADHSSCIAPDILEAQRGDASALALKEHSERSRGDWFSYKVREFRRRRTQVMGSNTLYLALLSAAVLGFRHGFDYDHIAAISDITSLENSRKRAMRMGLLYVLGHAVTVAALAAAVILFQRSLPRSIDDWAERVVGLTLLVLGLYVLGTLLREKTTYVPRSRGAILVNSRRWWPGSIRGPLAVGAQPRPERQTGPYRPTSVFVIGLIHGLGA